MAFRPISHLALKAGPSTASSSRFIRPFSSGTTSYQPQGSDFAGSFERLYRGGRGEGRDSAASSSSNSGSSTFIPRNETEQMLSRNGTATAESEAKRPRFTANKLLNPRDLATKIRDPSYSPRPKPALFGPPRHIAMKNDPFVLTGTGPMEHAYNPTFVQAFLDPMGRIKPRSETRLSMQSQKKIGKMVRRARAMGLVGVWSNRASRSGYGQPPGDIDYNPFADD